MLAHEETVRSDVAELFRDIFEYDGPLSRRTSPDDVPRWDSLQHIALVHAVEKTYGLSLSMDEMMELVDVGAIEKLLHRRGA
ncbi:MAG: acyl carrier protein [Hyphomicrobiaceae bacterium]|nr:acyl carrier protein [Hyphomicrobiaceae bacterium]